MWLPSPWPLGSVLGIDELAAEARLEVLGVGAARQSKRRACPRRRDGMSACAGKARGLRRRGGSSRSCGRCSEWPAAPPGAATADPSCLCSALLCDRPRHLRSWSPPALDATCRGDGGSARGVRGACGRRQRGVSEKEQKGNILGGCGAVAIARVAAGTNRRAWRLLAASNRGSSERCGNFSL